MLDRRKHWEKIYSEKKPDQVSWFQAGPKQSLELVKLAGIPQKGSVIDVGGGASVLVDRLLDEGFKNITVLDVSNTALLYAKERLGERAKQVKWVVKDVTDFNPLVQFDLWHDRAVFHFLIEEADRKKYASIVSRAVKPGGHLILASFALDGPNVCSNLPVCRYDAKLVQKELGNDFELIREETEAHRTPWDKEQKFKYFLFRRK